MQIDFDVAFACIVIALSVYVGTYLKIKSKQLILDKKNRLKISQLKDDINAMKHKELNEKVADHQKRNAQRFREANYE